MHHLLRRAALGASLTLAVPTALAEPARARSGVETQFVDPKVPATQDFYRHVNGKWLDQTAIPPDQARWGSFSVATEQSRAAIRELLEAAQKDASAAPGSERKKIGDYFKSFMDEARLESLGMTPLQPELLRIDAIKTKADLAAYFARNGRIDVSAPFLPIVHQDNRDATKYVVDLVQEGLGLPDRDYYLKDEPKLKATRTAYRAHVEKMLTLAGAAHAAQDADALLALETELARVQWTKVENRDPIKTYNKVPLAELAKMAPGFDWKRYLAEAGIADKVSYLIVSQPSYQTKLAGIVEATPLPVWQAYLRWHLIAARAPLLSKKFVDENFAFYGTALRDVPANEPRWKRGVNAVEAGMGEALGKLYVEQHFPASSKARMEALVANLLAAYKQSIDGLDWMGPATKKEAQAKLAKFTPKIGYPKTWRDYGKLAIKPDDLVGNVERADAFEYQRNIDKLGKPIDRDEWGMTPQTVNAYYNPELNEIVFPAAILVPPFFDAAADDAVNYGGIGAVIGHEISHGFDDQGSQYDGLGNLRDWWTAEDHTHFAAKTKALIAQYGHYEAVKGFPVNGELTLGENIADNSGLAIALKAYRLSLAGKPSPTIDGLTGEQRLFMGWAQVWRGKTREAEAVRRIKVDPHSPPEFRARGAVSNQDAFFESFGVKPTDGMWQPPGQRVHIW
jgi:putative endopeptidase